VCARQLCPTSVRRVSGLRSAVIRQPSAENLQFLQGPAFTDGVEGAVSKELHDQQAEQLVRRSRRVVKGKEAKAKGTAAKRGKRDSEL
jgi:hypothetical protein